MYRRAELLGRRVKEFPVHYESAEGKKLSFSISVLGLDIEIVFVVLASVMQ